MNRYNPRWIEEMTLKNPDIPVIEIDYREFKSVNIQRIDGKSFVPENKKSTPIYRNPPFSDTYSSRPKL